MSKQQIRKRSGGAGFGILALTGGPALMDGEDRKAFEIFLEKFLNSLCPRDPIEEILILDVAYLTWDILRIWRLRAKFLNSCADEGLRRGARLSLAN